MTDFLDIPALREEDEAAFRKQAGDYFATNSSAQSIVYAASQYWADEAADAVHTHGVVFPARDPWWPHACTYEAAPVDGSTCRNCNRAVPHFGSLDSNDGAVYAHSAFCSEYGGGEGETEFYEPLLIARREPDGTVSVERVAHLARAWMDFPNAFAEREDVNEEVPPGKPEPVPQPWSEAEAAMIDKVYAHPHDDGPRRILVDHWLEQSDPRGEFGALSFEGKAGKGDRAWLGPLTAVVGYAGVEFGRGPFPHRVTAYFEDAGTVEQHIKHREWATVESLRFAGESCGFSPAMAGLREVYGVTVAGLRALAEAEVQWKIHTLGLSVANDDPLELAQMWSRCTNLTEVRTLIVEYVIDDDLAPLLAALPAKKLERIEIWNLAAEGWNDPALPAELEQLVALPPGVELTVGSLTNQGSRAGLVANARSGSRTVRLELRGLGDPRQLPIARNALRRFELGPLGPKAEAVVAASPPPEWNPPPPPVAVPQQPWIVRE